MSSLTPRINTIEKQNVVNLLINGAFEFDQRNGGSSSVANNAYTVDRFFKSLGDSSQRVVVSQPTHKYAYELVASAGHAFEQRIEAKFLEGMVGKTLKFQCKIKLVSGTTFTPKIAVLHADAEDDWTTSTQDIIADLSGTLSGSFTVFKYSFVVTQDMANNGLAIKLGDLVDLTAHTVQYAQALLYIDNGQDIDVDFVRAGRNYPEELQLCQRYFEKSYSLDTAPGSITFVGVISGRYTISSNGEFVTRPFSTVKRSIPIVVPYNPVTGAVNSHRETSLSTNRSTSPVTAEINEMQCSFNLSTSTATYGFSQHWTADAEL